MVNLMVVKKEFEMAERKVELKDELKVVMWVGLLAEKMVGMMVVETVAQSAELKELRLAVLTADESAENLAGLKAVTTVVTTVCLEAETTAELKVVKKVVKMVAKLVATKVDLWAVWMVANSVGLMDVMSVGL